MLAEILEITDKSAFNHLVSGLFAYLFGVIDRRQYLVHVQNKVLARTLLKKAKASGYILRDCKLYAHAYWLHRHGMVRPKAADYGIDASDTAFLKKLNLVGLESYDGYNIPAFESLVASCVASKEITTYMGKLISKKMIFLTRSYGVTRDQLQNSLIDASLYALHKQYPRFESELHAQNVVKQTIHNTAMNLIKYHTRDKRQALRRIIGADGVQRFESINVGLDMIQEHEDTSVDHEKNDLLRSLVSLAPKMPPKVQNFLNAAAGGYDPVFSEHIGVRNDDLVETLPYPDYLERLREFHGVTDKQVSSLFARIREHV